MDTEKTTIDKLQEDMDEDKYTTPEFIKKIKESKEKSDCQTARCGRRKMRIVFGDFAAEPRNDFGGRRMLAA
jgi:hypothetical protein